MAPNFGLKWPWTVQSVSSRLPLRLRLLPFPAVRIIAILCAVNILAWAVVAILLRSHPLLSSSALLSYTLGLRHALDADHISVIDLMTRRLVATGSKPVTVGMWFSLGHSTIVVITCIVVAATSGALEQRFEGFRNVGSIVGTAVSAGVLIILGLGNAWILVKLIQRMRQAIKEEISEDTTVEAGDIGLSFEGGGIMVRLFKKIFKLIDHPWKMYPLGILFGLGFDTSSEIAVLGIASIQGVQGTSIWLILMFPALFTAGMCLLDTTDGALMMTLYTSTSLARDTIAILYYSVVLTAITVVVATCIGVIQLLTLVLNVAAPTGAFWDGVSNAGNHYDIVGGAICGTFVSSGVLSVFVYKPWRRRIDQRRNTVATEIEELQIDNKEVREQKGPE